MKFRIGLAFILLFAVYGAAQTQDWTIRDTASFFPAGVDTITLFGGSAVLWKDISYPASTAPYNDTFTLSAAPDTLPGFAPAGPSLSFASSGETPPVFVGVRYDTTVALDPLKIKLYRDSLGVLKVEHDSRVDTARKLVYVKTTNLKYPFHCFIDTTMPAITMLSNLTDCVGGNSVVDSFRLCDNISNCTWKLVAAKGSAALLAGSPSSSGEVSDTCARVATTTSTIGVGESGFRMLLIVTDGVNVDTVDISRCGVRLASDPYNTLQEFIQPVHTTALLSDSTPQAALQALFALTGGAYDNTRFRLYRWYPNPANTFANDKWVEYSSANAGVFTFAPGKLFWLITKMPIGLNFGEGRTVSLRDTFEIALQPLQWTDFSIPYQFGVHLRDVMRATGANGTSLQVYAWQKNEATGTYDATAYFLGGVPGKNSLQQVLSGAADPGYTVYNPLGSEATLRIPPTLSAMSLPRRIATTSTTAWSLRIAARIGSKPLPDLYVCSGERREETGYPLPPAFHRSKQYFPDGNDGASVRFLSPNQSEAVLPVRFYNGESRAGEISGAFETLSQLPAGIEYALQSEAGKVVSTGDTFTLSLPARKEAVYNLVIGNHAFIGRAPSPAHDRFEIESVVYAESAGRIRIDLNVPEYAEHITFELYSAKGEQVYYRRVRRAQLHMSIPFSESFPAGMYFGQIVVRDKHADHVRIHKISFPIMK
ncbi:MAG: hypothetical protein GF398_14820 [Chitinivibrionales bacterium]|nr:hypothetical protein [Chitinivibrionales bacterium]